MGSAPTPVAAFGSPEAIRPAWGAIAAMTLCVFVLIASEFMPASLLTPIAEDLRLTEGQAGQAIAMSGLFAVATALLVTRLFGRIDRRLVMVGMALLLAVSGVLVAFAPNYPVLMVGRALLGIAIGGFYSFSTSVVMRLLPAAQVPMGIAATNAGVALATTISAPLGSYMGEWIGWRWTFLSVVPLALLAAAWLLWGLPRLPAQGRPRGGALLLLRRGPVALGMAAILLVFVGQFGLVTYLRPFLEQVTGVVVPTLSTLLLVVGVAGVVGTALIGPLLRAGLPVVLVGVPLILAATATALALAGLGTSVWATAALLAIWGLAGTMPPVAWGTWLSRTLPEDAEAGGGLMVAVIQLAITLGATLGGLVFDGAGPVPNAGVSAAVLLLAGLAALVACRVRPASSSAA